MFDSPPIKDLRVIVLLKRVITPLLIAYLCIGFVSAYRAWYQVRSLDLKSSDSILHAGSNIETRVVSYARTTVDVRVELVQGAHTEMVSFQRVPDNEWAFFDPRNRQTSQTAIITDDLLSRFAPGKAELRATAVGRPQWTRLPPPVVRELTIEIEPGRRPRLE